MDRRLDVSEDPYSRARIHGLKEAARRLADLPGSIAFSVYGSLSKGKVLTEQTAPASDIDMFVWIDSDDIAKKMDAITTRPDFVAWFNHRHQTSSGVSKREVSQEQMRSHVLHYVQEQIEITIRQALQEQESSGFSPGKDPVDVRFMSERDVTRSVYTLEDLIEYDDHLDAMRDGDASDETDERKWFHDEDTPAQLEQMVWRLKGLFGLGVGGGLQHFQEMFVKELVDYFGDRAPRAWDTLVQTLGARKETFIRHQQLPQTLDDALRVYDLKKI